MRCWSPTSGSTGAPCSPLRTGTGPGDEALPQRFIHHGGLPDFTALRFTRYNQYESMILPMLKYLEAHGVQFHFNTRVVDVEFDLRPGRKQARPPGAAAGRGRGPLIPDGKRPGFPHSRQAAWRIPPWVPRDSPAPFRPG